MLLCVEGGDKREGTSCRVGLEDSFSVIVPAVICSGNGGYVVELLCSHRFGLLSSSVVVDEGDK